MKECPICHKQHNKPGIYCSRNCYYIREPGPKALRDKFCAVCGVRLKSYKRTYCSINCSAVGRMAERNKDRSEWVKVCNHCGKEFRPTDKLKAYGLKSWLSRKYCSLKCVGLAKSNFMTARSIKWDAEHPPVEESKRCPFYPWIAKDSEICLAQGKLSCATCKIYGRDNIDNSVPTEFIEIPAQARHKYRSSS